MDIVIDKEFAALGTALTAEERNLLEADIDAHGCLDSLKVWQGQNILLDGHNRYGICKDLDKPYKVEALPFPNREAAVEWVIDYQLGRRNANEDVKAYYRGKRYQHEKNKPGAKEGNESASKNKGATVTPLKTSERLASEYGVSPKTIKNDAAFAEAIDTIDEVAPEFKATILSGKAKVTKKKVVEMAQLEPTEMKAAAEAATQPKEERRSLVSAIESLMKDGKPRTLTEIQNACGRSDAATISARLRDLKRKYSVTHDKDSKRYTLSPLTAEDKPALTFPQRLKWASKRKSVTVDEIAEEFGIAAVVARREIVAANQCTGYLVSDIGDGDYVVRKAVHFASDEQVANFKEAIAQLKDMTEEAMRLHTSASSLTWSYESQAKYLGKVLKIVNAFSRG